jgi:quercetin dioxygenase-like cupin family protein
MKTVQLEQLDLIDTWLEGDEDTARVQVNFPLNKASGADASAVVYFELERGKRLGRHTDSAEEIILLLSGTAEAVVDGERGRLSAGEMALIPAMAPHELINTGEETVRVVGFFSEPLVTSTFEEPLMPMAQAVLEQGAAPPPEPVAA